jgi:hypothetical protein
MNEFLSPAAVGFAIGISAGTVRFAIEHGALKATRFGDRWLVLQSDAWAWWAKREARVNKKGLPDRRMKRALCPRLPGFEGPPGVPV